MKQKLKFILMAVAACVGNAQAANITVVNFGGANGDAQKAAYYEPFQKSTGIQVIPVEYAGELGKLKAMVDMKKVTWDVVVVEQSSIGRACGEGLLEKIDVARIGSKNDFIVGSIHECGIGQVVWADVMAYNADKLKVAPKSWADFWDVKKFPGKRGMHKAARETLEYALMADGVPTRDVYKVLAMKLGVDRAFKKLDELKPYIQWWEAGSQPQQLLVAGDVVMSTAYAGRIDAAQREGKNLQIVWAGSLYGVDYWTIPKGSPNKAAAEKLIAFASTPQAQKRFIDRISYGPTNVKTLKLLDAKTLAKLPNSSDNIKDAVLSDVKFWDDHGEDLEQRFAAWASR